MLVEEVVEEPTRALEFDTSGAFVQWPIETQGIPYGKTHQYGPGEARLAYIMGIKGPEGPTKTFDLLDAAGMKWEVKHPNNSGKIRLGGESIAAAADAKDEIQHAAAQISRAWAMIKGNPDILARLDEGFQKQLEEFVDGPKNHMQNIKKGNITANRVLLIKDIAEQFFYLQEMLSKKTWTVYLGGREHRVDTKKMSKIIDVLGLEGGDVKMGDEDKLLSVLQSPVFDDPDGWYKKNWSDIYPPSVAFSKVNGLILVNKDGYKTLLPEMIPKFIFFNEISAMRVIYSVDDPHFRRRSASPNEEQFLDDE